MELVDTTLCSQEHLNKCEAALRFELSAWGDDQVAEAQDPLLTGVPAGTAGTSLGAKNLIPSKRVLDASAIVQEILGFRIPPMIIREGGYKTTVDFVDDIVSKLRDVVAGKIKVKPKKAKQWEDM